VLAGAVASRSINLERLAPRLGPFAARFGFPVGEGEQVLAHLLELGGATDQVVADGLIEIARAHNLGLAEMLRAVSAPGALELSETLQVALRVLQHQAVSTAVL
jgi:hypothetical protein